MILDDLTELISLKKYKSYLNIKTEKIEAFEKR
jgi:hypothetical protein